MSLSVSEEARNRPSRSFTPMETFGLRSGCYTWIAAAAPFWARERERSHVVLKQPPPKCPGYNREIGSNETQEEQQQQPRSIHFPPFDRKGREELLERERERDLICGELIAHCLLLLLSFAGKTSSGSRHPIRLTPSKQSVRSQSGSHETDRERERERERLREIGDGEKV